MTYYSRNNKNEAINNKIPFFLSPCQSLVNVTTLSVGEVSHDDFLFFHCFWILAFYDLK